MARLIHCSYRFWLDFTFPYLTEPLMGHTWDSYYYHHVKHHHVEGNGPDDLSSTVRYQRDDVLHFLHYVGRFLFFTWLELPLYFLRKNKTTLAIRAFVSELASLSFLYYITVKVNTRAAIFVVIIPFTLLRLGLMVGNWGQHALVDELEPDSDFRSSITLVDVPVSMLQYTWLYLSLIDRRAIVFASMMVTIPLTISTRADTGGNSQCISCNRKKPIDRAVRSSSTILTIS